eukprot:scaffold296974_cov129-Cyclotella_meneghiniana.AAC.2
MSKHIVKVKAPRSGSERLELVLDPNWKVTAEEDENRDDDEELSHPELTQSFSRHSYHSESTCETDNRISSRVTRTYSLESDGSLSRTDFESDAYREMERRGVSNLSVQDDMESIDEEDEMMYHDVEEDEGNADENEYYAGLEGDVVALQNTFSGEQSNSGSAHGIIANPASESYRCEEDGATFYHVNNGACVVKDVSRGCDRHEEEELDDHQVLSYDDEDQQLSAMSPESDVYAEVYEDSMKLDTSDATVKSFRRGVSFDEESLNKQELDKSSRSQDRAKPPLLRMPSEDTSVASVGYRVVTNVKQNNTAPVLNTNAIALSPSILKEPKYASNVASPRGKENAPRRRQPTRGQAPPLAPVSPRAIRHKTVGVQPRPLSPTQNSDASPSSVLNAENSVQSRGSNAAVGISPRNNAIKKQRWQQQQLQRQRQEEEQRSRQQHEEQTHLAVSISPRGKASKQKRRQQQLQQQRTEDEREQLRQQQEEEEEEQLRQQEEEDRLLQQQYNQQQRAPLQAIDQRGTRDDVNPWSQYNAIPKLARSPSGLSSGLSRLSEGMRSTAALDGFTKESPRKPKISWFRTKKQSRPITTTVNEVARPKSKTKLMKKFFGIQKKTDADVDKEDSNDAPLPAILTSDRPMRVHTNKTVWDDETDESVGNTSTLSQNSRQSIKSSGSRHSIKSHGSRQTAHSIDSDRSNHRYHVSTRSKNVCNTSPHNNNPWTNKTTEPMTKANPKITRHDLTAKAKNSIPTNNAPNGAYNLDGAGMPSFKWWTWSQPDESGKQKESTYCAMMCVFPPAAEE